MWTTQSRKQFNFCGYDTYASELCHVFGVRRSTFQNRIVCGWPLAAALVAESSGGWCSNNAFLLAERPEVLAYCKAMMDAYMAEKLMNLRNIDVLEAGSEIKLPGKVQQFVEQNTAKPKSTRKEKV
jgi:hypothetical protein